LKLTDDDQDGVDRELSQARAACERLQSASEPPLDREKLLGNALSGVTYRQLSVEEATNLMANANLLSQLTGTRVGPT
jgi:hypothetical protein